MSFKQLMAKEMSDLREYPIAFLDCLDKVPGGTAMHRELDQSWHVNVFEEPFTCHERFPANWTAAGFYREATELRKLNGWDDFLYSHLAEDKATKRRPIVLQHSPKIY